jgi:hypothetical protein
MIAPMLGEIADANKLLSETLFDIILGYIIDAKDNPTNGTNINIINITLKIKSDDKLNKLINESNGLFRTQINEIHINNITVVV